MPSPVKSACEAVIGHGIKNGDTYRKDMSPVLNSCRTKERRKEKEGGHAPEVRQEAYLRHLSPFKNPGESHTIPLLFDPAVGLIRPKAPRQP